MVNIFLCSGWAQAPPRKEPAQQLMLVGALRRQWTLGRTLYTLAACAVQIRQAWTHLSSQGPHEGDVLCHMPLCKNNVSKHLHLKSDPVSSYCIVRARIDSGLRARFFLPLGYKSNKGLQARFGCLHRQWADMRLQARIGSLPRQRADYYLQASRPESGAFRDIGLIYGSRLESGAL